MHIWGIAADSKFLYKNEGVLIFGGVLIYGVLRYYDQFDQTIIVKLAYIFHMFISRLVTVPVKPVPMVTLASFTKRRTITQRLRSILVST